MFIALCEIANTTAKQPGNEDLEDGSRQVCNRTDPSFALFECRGGKGLFKILGLLAEELTIDDKALCRLANIDCDGSEWKEDAPDHDDQYACFRETCQWNRPTL